MEVEVLYPYRMEEDYVMLKVSDAAADNLYPALFQCFVIILCGYVAGRTNVISRNQAQGLAHYVGTFALPALIFMSLLKLDFKVVNWSFLLSMLLAKAIIFVSVVLVTLFISKPLNLGRAGIFGIFCTQSNDFALGYPIINAIYGKSHPEYTSYLYLMAPISLAILNPLAFLLMEIHKYRRDARSKGIIECNILGKIILPILMNPVVTMTIFGIISNIAFEKELPAFIEGLLEIFGKSFTATALFLLGLRMVGQFHRLKGPALVLPFVLIMVKLLILPVVMRHCVTLLGKGKKGTDSLATYAFIYGTIPTAPAVFVFSHAYQLEVDLIASSMVICTFVSGPLMFVSAQMISITKDYSKEFMKFCFQLSLASSAASLWVLCVFIVLKRYKKMPHRITMCLIISQLLLTLGIASSGPASGQSEPSWVIVARQSLIIFAMFSCLLWTSMLSVALVFLQTRGPCFVQKIWPMLALVGWGGPAAILVALLGTRAQFGNLAGPSVDAIRLFLLIFCLAVTFGSLVLYLRFRRRVTPTVQPDADEDSPLLDHAEPSPSTSQTSNNGCYGTITVTPSPNLTTNGCCTNDPNCDNINTTVGDIEDIGQDDGSCACPPASRGACVSRGGGPCPYGEGLDDAGQSLGMSPPELAGHQLLAHTVLMILYTLAMFINLTFTVWSTMLEHETGIFTEIEYLDAVATYGQGLITMVIFGISPQDIVTPIIRWIKMKCFGTDEILVLPPVEDLPFETTHVCAQFVDNHLEECKAAIAKDVKWRLRTYRGVFRGSCLVRWLVSTRLAHDNLAATHYGRTLLDGRVLQHITQSHHFSDSELLYTFIK